MPTRQQIEIANSDQESELKCWQSYSRSQAEDLVYRMKREERKQAFELIECSSAGEMGEAANAR